MGRCSKHWLDWIRSFQWSTHPTLSNTVSSKHDSGNWLFIKTLCLTCLCAAPSFHLNLGLLLRLPQTTKNQEKTREPMDEEDQSHAEVKHKKQSSSTLTTSCDSETFLLISYSGWVGPPKVVKNLLVFWKGGWFWVVSS